MDRMRQLKLAMTRLKKRSFGPKPPKFTSEESMARKKAYDSTRVKEFYKRRHGSGKCARCENDAVDIIYEHRGKILVKRRCHFCPHHWGSVIIRQEMLDAILNVKTVHTVHPMVTLKSKSNAGVAG